MDVKGARPANGTPIGLYTCNGTNAQSWSLQPVSGYYGSGYQIISSLSGSCLDVSGVSVLDGARIHEWNCIGPNHSNQVWQIYPFGDHVELVSLNSGKCLDIPGGSTTNGNELQQLICGQGKNLDELWTLSPTSIAPQPRVSASLSALNFGSVSVGSSKALTLTLTSSGTSPLTISSLPIKGSGYSLTSSAAAPLTLNAGGTVSLTVQYQPTVAGPASGALSINSNSTTSSAFSIPLNGAGVSTGTPQLTVSASSLSFGSVPLGSSKSLSTTLTASGTSPVTINSLSLSNSGYSLASNAAVPLTLNPGGTVTLTVTYHPTVAGSALSLLTINSNSTTSSSLGVALSGASAGAQHSVDLSWEAPPNSPDAVAGYRVYRSTGGGSSVLLNYTLTTQGSYVDATVTNGSSYLYVVKSVDGSGVESVDSNTFTVAIPLT